MTDHSKPETDVLRVAKALHKFELEHGYISREWGPIEDVYMAMAKVAIASISAQQTLSEMEARKDAAYEERNQVVAALAKIFPSGTARTEIPGWSADWHGCVYIDLPTGQVSWHYHDSQHGLFAGLPLYTKPWDGHDTTEKYRRLAALTSLPPQESPDDRCSADMTLAHNSRMAAIEEIIRFIEDGSFLHDDAPPKRFARELVAAIRDRLLPDLSQEATETRHIAKIEELRGLLSREAKDLRALWLALDGGPKPRCRDCADEPGICPSDKLPCDPQERALKQIELLRILVERQRKALNQAELALDQAQDCINAETPEDITFGEAEDDTISKIREAMRTIAAVTSEDR